MFGSELKKKYGVDESAEAIIEKAFGWDSEATVLCSGYIDKPAGVAFLAYTYEGKDAAAIMVAGQHRDGSIDRFPSRCGRPGEGTEAEVIERIEENRRDFAESKRQVSELLSPLAALDPSIKEALTRLGM